MLYLNWFQFKGSTYHLIDCEVVKVGYLVDNLLYKFVVFVSFLGEFHVDSDIDADQQRTQRHLLSKDLL